MLGKLFSLSFLLLILQVLICFHQIVNRPFSLPSPHPSLHLSPSFPPIPFILNTLEGSLLTCSGVTRPCPLLLVICNQCSNHDPCQRPIAYWANFKYKGLYLKSSKDKRKKTLGQWYLYYFLIRDVCFEEI